MAEAASIEENAPESEETSSIVEGLPVTNEPELAEASLTESPLWIDEKLTEMIEFVTETSALKEVGTVAGTLAGIPSEAEATSIEEEPSVDIVP